jgi:exodeoxyribonuclease-1
MVPLYKARNYPKSLSGDEREVWDAFCFERLQGGGEQSQIAKFAKRLQELAQDAKLSQNKQYLLEELQLYAESILVVQD